MNDSEVEAGNPEEGRDTSVSKGAYFAPGKAATFEHGVLYQGDYQNEADGTGIAIRLHARALASTGVPVLLKPFSGLVQTTKGSFEPMHIAGISDAVRAEVLDLPNTSIAKLSPVIRHFIVHKRDEISNRVMRGATSSLEDPEMMIRIRKAAYSGSVLYSVWERDSVDSGMARELNRMTDNWVPCEQNAEMLRRSGVENVFVVPHPFDPESTLVKLTRRKPLAEKRFYFIGRWEPRKNPVEILWAFAEAFAPGDAAHLTMKFHGGWDCYPNFDQTISDILLASPKWTKEKILAHVTTIRGHIRPDQIMRLHFENNIYLSPSCGEAWCLPAFEAKIGGNLVIHTPFGGTADFCEESDIALPYVLEDVPPTYGWAVGSRWARPNGEELVQAMLRVKAPASYSRSAIFEEKFNLKAVGARMRGRLAEVFGNTKSGEYLK